MNGLSNKVALITGAGRGQGRAHAVTLARAGVDIAAVDICRDLPYPRYHLATEEDLAETVAQVEAQGRQALGIAGDVRSAADMKHAVEATLEQYGHIDILICNAGITDMAESWDLTEEWWDIMLDVNLKGCWLPTKYAIPHMIERGQGGRIIMTSSVAGVRGLGALAHYCAAKHGVLGLMKSMALELAPYHITVNALCPTNVDTDLLPGMASAAGIPFEDFLGSIGENNVLPIETVKAEDIANAALFLASDAARYITGQQLNIDAGMLLK